MEPVRFISTRDCIIGQEKRLQILPSGFGPIEPG
jgi:hypothetical protein